MTPMMRYPMFADEVISSTELTRNTSEVLDQALKGPVTISRRSEQFALLSRSTAARMTRTLVAATLAVEHLEEILRVKATHRARAAHYSWMQVYEKDDLEKFQSELMEATLRALSDEGEPSEVGDLIHEWRESGMAVQSGVIDNVMHDPSVEKVQIVRPKEGPAL